jgi:membrane-bound metal-dependent hydrolase YbcI (DUF457 family)
MPYTPYHFGPSGFVALALRKWIDVPVFVLANVVVDIEVLVVGFLHLGYPTHRYCHTLAFAVPLGAAWGVAAYFILRRPFQYLMSLLRIRYKPSPIKMVVSGSLGAALHVLIDAFHHYDVFALWPNKIPLRRFVRHIEQESIKTACLYFLLPVAVLYIHAVISYRKNEKVNNTHGNK